MKEVYVIVGWYSDGGAPSVDFANTPDEAIKASNEKSKLAQEVTVFKVSDGDSGVVFGKDLRTTRAK